VTDYRERLPAALAGERLDRVVALVTGASRAEAAALVAEGGVSVNGRAVTAKAHRVAEDDEVAVSWSPPEVGAGLGPDPSVAFVVVYEDDDVVVIDKPAGLVVHPGAGNDAGTLVHGLLARYPEMAEVGQPERPGIVHRLDKETSGLLMVARSAEAYDDLVAQLASRLVDRRYLALAWGTFERSAGMIDAPVGRSAKEPTRMAVTERGREAITHFEVRTAFHDPVAVTLLDCKLETGRTHQIRVHLAAIGHPVVGDDRYRGVRSSLPVPRLFLHAGALAFDHPVTGEPLSFTVALPADLQAVLDRLG
jgi:23S rRNA pseudouridine1911/1915/1917 synthase